MRVAVKSSKIQYRELASVRWENNTISGTPPVRIRVCRLTSLGPAEQVRFHCYVCCLSWHIVPKATWKQSCRFVSKIHDETLTDIIATEISLHQTKVLPIRKYSIWMILASVQRPHMRGRNSMVENVEDDRCLIKYSDRTYDNWHRFPFHPRTIDEHLQNLHQSLWSIKWLSWSFSKCGILSCTLYTMDNILLKVYLWFRVIDIFNSFLWISSD